MQGSLWLRFNRRRLGIFPHSPTILCQVESARNSVTLFYLSGTAAH